MRTEKGVRLLFQKSPAIDRPTAVWTDIAQVVLPYTYFSDVEVTSAVSLYDTVRRGTPLAVSEDPSGPVLSSVTGAVSSERVVAHPLYGELRCAVIDCLPAEPDPELPAPQADPFTAEEICEAAEWAHIIDELDGVPLANKLRDWQQHGCHYLVADAVQVQPYESSAWAILRDYAEQVTEGLSLAALAAGAKRHHIAVCLSGQRRRSLALRVGKDGLYQTDSYYPTAELVRVSHKGGKHTVSPKETVGRIGPQACWALYRALYYHEPHDRCVLTVAGDAVRDPQNVMVPFGTTVQEVLSRCGLKQDPSYLILGEMMTGTTAPTQDIPILPGMTCVLAFTETAIRSVQPRNCIGCGRCAQVCHQGLLPFEIARRFGNMHYERLGQLEAASCDSCGACSYVCPCGIDLTSIVAEARSTDSTILLEMEDDPDA
ncbi:MAG: 4Fe-4S dicluster domain-containing protein [Clostridia bacterium]|nr:4Fe-4S dicluster domain-containing protein [Clostridia bacterium]